MTFGAVLCGGASRRMGRDKALLERDGAALAVRVAEALRAGGCDEVRAIGGDGPALRARGLEVVPDAHPGEGPLGGLATALEALSAAAPAGALLALAPCDLLDPDPTTAATLLAALVAAPAEVDVVVPVIDGRNEWVVSAWRVRPRTASAVAGLLAAGHRRLDAVDQVVGALRIDGLGRAAVADADRPEDLA